MGFKAKFKGREVLFKEHDEKDKHNQAMLARPNLKLLKPMLQVNANLENKNMLSGDQQMQGALITKLNFYHRINELFQDHSLSLFKLIEGLLSMVTEVLEVEGGSLWIFDEHKKNLNCKVALGLYASEVTNESIAVGKGVIGTVFQTKASEIVNNPHQDPRKNYINKNIKNCLVVPLVYHNDTIGIIEIINKKGTIKDGFDESDKYFLEDIAVPSAMHIKTSRLMREQQKILNQMNTFKDLHEVFSSTLELDKLLCIVLQKAIGIVTAEVGSIWLVEDSGEGIVCHIAEGPTKDKVMGVKIKKSIGIVGWVVDHNESQIVEDCKKDPRFSVAVDKKIGFATETMITVPLTVKQEVIGAIQVINKKGGLLFNVDDLDLLKLFASSSAMYIKNARLFSAEKKAEELSALINISREITSTLDLDSVLMTIVNLSSKIIKYDFAAISLKRPRSEQWEMRAQSGMEKIDKEDAMTRKLEEIHNLLSGEKEELYVNGVGSYNSQHKSYHSEVEAYMKERALECFWCYVLKDDQGPLGVFTMESKEKNLLNDSKVELLSILISQSTVAVRNAELYNIIPAQMGLQGLKNKLLTHYETFMAWPQKKKLMAVTSVVAGIAAFFIIHLPYSVTGDVEIIPWTDTYYAKSKGAVDAILVKEGQAIKRGELLMVLDSKDTQLELQGKLVQKEKVYTEMIKNRFDKKVAEYKIKESEWFSLKYEIEILQQKLQDSKIVAKEDGVVVTDKLDELKGKPVNFGQELIKLSGYNKMYVQFNIPQDEIVLVKTDQEVKFKLFGIPSSTFSDSMKLESVGGMATQILETDPTKYFLARALITNIPHNIKIRPGMTGKGKVSVHWQSLAYILFNKPWRMLLTEVIF
ncbi:MAG: GAF domain-containing protein [Oligoflexia bacterium]|nr:GAF domain-containing protein [Oligoflexia bacterium]MBF0365531.1 GAF domain-containing protein [Oligoflexia bacterium]